MENEEIVSFSFFIEAYYTVKKRKMERRFFMIVMIFADK